MASFTSLIEWLQRQPAERRFTASLIEPPPDGRKVGLVDGSPFTAGASYLSVRLMEMQLANARELLQTLMPMTIMLGELPYDGKLRPMPLIVSNDLVRSSIKITHDVGRVQFENVYLCRDLPAGVGLSLFVGLFRVVQNDLAAELLSLVSALAPALGGAPVGLAADVATKIYDRVTRVIGAEGVTPVLCHLNGSIERCGYLVYANCAEGKLQPERLAVVNGRLHSKVAGGRTEPVTGLDYALVAVERTGSRADSNTLRTPALDVLWQNVTKAQISKGADEAEVGLQRLLSAVMASPDHTYADQIALITLYNRMLEELKAALAPARQNVSTRAASNAGFRLQLAAEQNRLRARNAHEVVAGLEIVVAELGSAGSIDRQSIENGEALDHYAASTVAQVTKSLPVTSSYVADLAASLTAARLRKAS